MGAITIPSFSDKHLDASFRAVFADIRSEAERQERIAKVARRMEQDMYASLLTNAKDSFDVADDIPGNWMTPDIEKLLRAALVSNKDAVYALVMQQVDAAVKRVAQDRAEKHVEEHGAD